MCQLYLRCNQQLQQWLPDSHDVAPAAGSASKAEEAGGSDMQSAVELQWEDRTVQQCLELCSNVDLVYKLLIQEIQPVLGRLPLLLPFSCLRSYLACLLFCVCLFP